MTARQRQWEEESRAMEAYFTSPTFQAIMAAERAKEAVIKTAKAEAAAALEAQRQAKAEAERNLRAAHHQVQCMINGRLKSTAGNRRLAVMLLKAATEARRSA